MHRILKNRTNFLQFSLCFLLVQWQIELVHLAEVNNSTSTATKSNQNDAYCAPKLCEFYNGTDLVQLEHVACGNNGSFASNCGPTPNLLDMNERRRNFILDMHNLARSRIASGMLKGYDSASHMPILKWDNDLEYLASLHVKRCRFYHDQCRNTPKYAFSGQNIGYFWIERDFKSHSKRMKTFVINWFREYVDANQTYINSYRPHPKGKKIGHFTLLVSDRVHRVGCAALRYGEVSTTGSPSIGKREFLMTCNYDFNNIYNEPVYQTGKPASKCSLRPNKKFPSLCDWNKASYQYDKVDKKEKMQQLNNNNSTLKRI